MASKGVFFFFPILVKFSKKLAKLVKLAQGRRKQLSFVLGCHLFAWKRTVDLV
jgi:hypothetical protein